MFIVQWDANMCRYINSEINTNLYYLRLIILKKELNAFR